MKHTFFVTGYPRSRTAWLANFLTYSNSFCYHEAIKWAPPAAIPELFAATGAAFVGTSDSTLPFYIDQVWDKVPDPKLVIIERPPGEAWESFLAYIRPAVDSGSADIGFLQEAFTKTGHALAQAKEKYPKMVVKYEALSRPSTCKLIWNYCLPGEPFDERRWMMLNAFNVRVMLDQEQDNLADAASTIQQLVSDFPAPQLVRTTLEDGKR